MAAVVRGAVVLDLMAGDVALARRLLDELRSGRLSAGAFTVHADGRATYSLDARWLELGRVLQAAGLATCVSVTTSLAFNWTCYAALSFGLLIGVGWAAALIVFDRRRMHHRARAFLRALPDLVRARRGQMH
jgi:hypothetical protein